MKKIFHLKICEHCGADLTKADSVNVHFSVGGHEFDKLSSVDDYGQLYDIVDGQRAERGLIVSGYHAGSLCVACDEAIEELFQEVQRKCHLTYRELLKKLIQADNCELDQDVTVYHGGLDEFYPVTGFCWGEDKGKENPAAGVLDDGHLYLEFDMGGGS